MSAPASPPKNPPQVDPASLVPPAMRSDLIATEQTYLGRKYVVYKNPLGFSFFRLPVAHAEAASRFDGRIKIGDLAGQLARESKYWRALPPDQALGELAALASQLSSAGLLRVHAVNASDRSRRMRELKKSRFFEMAVGKILFFKKSIIDPDAFLERYFPLVRWVYARPTMILAGLFLLLSLIVALQNWDRITVQGANFFTLSNLGLTWVLFLGVKIVHEFGHAFTCKRYGGEVHEMGFMFILFTPYLFCNVSDAWRANKGQRIAVTASGIVIELFLAAVAVWLWLFSQPGLFNQMCFNAMVLCSVSTVLFNANPLMKFDGYYIMTDVLEVPNLRAKSNAWITAWAQRYLLGMRSAAARLTGHEIGPAFGIYAVAAYCYMWFIMFNISVMIFDMLEPYGLEIVSRTYVGLFLFVSLALPLVRLGRSIKGSEEFRQAGVRRVRSILVWTAVILAALFFVPWQETVKRSAALEHGGIVQISSPAPGFLVELLAGEGEVVAVDQRLGRLENIELDSELVDLRLQREATLVRLRSATADDSTEARLSVPVIQKYVQELDEQIRGVEERVKALVLSSPRAGIVRTSQVEDLLGAHFQANQPVLELGDSSGPRLLVALDEKQARRVQPGQKLRVRFKGLADRSFDGEIVRVPVSPGSRFTALGFANELGGDVPSELDATGRLIPSIPYFEAEATLDISAEDLARIRPGSIGVARIEIRSTNLGTYLREKVLEAVDPSIRL